MRSKVNMQAIYAQCVKSYTAAKFPNARISKSALISILAIPSAGMTNANFNINANLGTSLPTEVRLQVADEFTITQMGFYLSGTVGSTTGPAGTVGTRYWTYSPVQLSSVFVALLPAYDSGTFILTFNGVQYVKNWDTNRHYVVPRTQDTPFTTPSNSTLGSQVLGEDGMDDMEPTIRVSGAKTNQVVATFPNAISPITNYSFVENSNTLFVSISNVVTVFRGLLAQNVSTIN